METRKALKTDKNCIKTTNFQFKCKGSISGALKEAPKIDPLKSASYQLVEHILNKDIANSAEAEELKNKLENSNANTLSGSPRISIEKKVSPFQMHENKKTLYFD